MATPGKIKDIMLTFIEFHIWVLLNLYTEPENKHGAKSFDLHVIWKLYLNKNFIITQMMRGRMRDILSALLHSSFELY
jgi:hypothetical protein